MLPRRRCMDCVHLLISMLIVYVLSPDNQPCSSILFPLSILKPPAIPSTFLPQFQAIKHSLTSLPSVRFYDDAIFSRASQENCIVLWEITGFDSLGPVPTMDNAPTQHEAANGHATLTSFTDGTKFDPYVRLIEYVYFFGVRFLLGWGEGSNGMTKNEV